MEAKISPLEGGTAGHSHQHAGADEAAAAWQSMHNKQGGRALVVVVLLGC